MIVVRSALFLLVAIAACDRPQVSDAPGDDPPVPAATPVAATPTTATAATVVASSATASPTAVDCDALTRHIHDIVRTAGTARAREVLPAQDELRRECEADTNDPALVKCFLDARDPAGLAECNRRPFEGEVDATAKRSFDALAKNDGVTPEVFTQDGDYLAFDRDCGAFYKEVAPAAAVFIRCKGRIEIGPLVTVDEVDGVFAKLSADESRRHEVVMSLIGKLNSKPWGVPVRVYDRDGNYQGIEYR